MYAPLFYEFDPKTPGATLAPVDFPGRPDMFCCHYVQLPDGRILAAGGSQHDAAHAGGVTYRGSNGSKTIGMYDPVTSSWLPARTGGTTHELAQGRWYPTLVALPDGRVAAFSGRREFGVPAPAIADDVEILSPPDCKATSLTTPTKRLLPIYPGLHLAPNGRIYFTHANWGQEIPDPDTASILISPGATSATWQMHSAASENPALRRREEAMSVLLPPAQDGKILLIGGSRALKADGTGVLQGAPPYGAAAFDHIENPADARSAEILDTSGAAPSWSSAGLMTHGRINGHCVLLPDATVLICGGHNNYKWLPRPATQPSLQAEIYTPGVGFRPVASMTVPRMYHSVALLLPDGRVFTAGGADANTSEPTLTYPPGWNPERQYGPGMAENLKTFEFYEPPYMHNGPRPTIIDVTRSDTSTRRIEYGQSFVVKTPQAATINRVALMRPAAVTHHTDTEQRYVRLTFTTGTNQLNVTMVDDARVAPPGYYMLWIVDSQGRPCEEAVFVHLVPKVGQPGGGTTCVVVTACFGSPQHEHVLYLQRLRHELYAGSRAGRRFIGAVNRLYGAVSPPVARRVAAHARLRRVMRGLLVTPAVTAIRGCNRAAAGPLRQPLLIALLTAAALVGLIALPALAGIAAGALAWLVISDRWAAGPPPVAPHATDRWEDDHAD
jgi:hypothetical protein